MSEITGQAEESGYALRQCDGRYMADAAECIGGWSPSPLDAMIFTREKAEDIAVESEDVVPITRRVTVVVGEPVREPQP